MRESAVSKVYAKALIELAVEANVIDVVGADLKSFVSLMEANDFQLGAALASPVFTSEERAKVLNLLLPKCDFHPLTVNLLRLANDKNRLPIMDEISHAYQTFADKHAGRVRVKVVTAEPMTPQVEAEVRAALAKTTGKEVILHSSVDPTLLGGMVATVGGTVYDSSIRTRLQNLRSALLTGAGAQA